MSVNHNVVFDSSGHTGNTYYVRFVRRSDGYIWDAVAEEWAATPSWEDSAIALTETSDFGQFNVSAPDAVGEYDYYQVVYKQDSSIPQNTDEIELQTEYYNAHNYVKVFGTLS